MRIWIKSSKRILFINFLLVNNFHPVGIAWRSGLTNSIPECVDIILNDWILFAHTFSILKVFFCWLSISISIAITIKSILKVNDIKTSWLKNSWHKHNCEEEKEDKFIYLIKGSINQLYHSSKVRVVLNKIQCLPYKHNQN